MEDGVHCLLTSLPGGQGPSENQAQTALMNQTVSTNRTRTTWVTPRRMKRKSLELPTVQTTAASRLRWTYKLRRRYSLPSAECMCALFVRQCLTLHPTR